MRFLRLLIVFVILAALASQAARFLVVDEPEKSDAIVVLAGETNVRPARALELLRQGVAPRVFLDAETRDLIYDQPLVDIARKYASGLAEANRISVCPIAGFSTQAEADDVSRCLQPLGAHRVLIVTSASHTRRALTIFAIACRNISSTRPQLEIQRISAKPGGRTANGQKPLSMSGRRCCGGKRWTGGGSQLPVASYQL